MKRKVKTKVWVLGLTGSLASGKTTVTAMFKRLGAFGIDADKIYHHLSQPGQLLYARLVAAFGQQILHKNKKIDRRRLSRLVFNEERRLSRLCRLTHPAIIKKIKATVLRLKQAGTHAVIVIDAPLLIETGLSKMVDKLVVVKLNRKNQLLRCRKKGITHYEAARRIKAQLPLAKKVRLADYVIDNNGTRRKTRRQVKEIWRSVMKLLGLKTEVFETE